MYKAIAFKKTPGSRGVISGGSNQNFTATVLPKKGRNGGKNAWKNPRKQGVDGLESAGIFEVV